ncbi:MULTISPECIES: flagellar filament capping protein FliD [unclassified Nocardioides]|uniref:flagellar filament capping protein FliD n=1 Tax=unclassified Nocardioides TaxID=2615069 RepID=UPI003610B86A
MATSSVSGLVSGLDTATIIDQLMQLEAVPQTRMKNEQTAEKSVLTALRSLNTAVSGLADKAAALAKPATWQTLVPTITGTGVTATVGSTASASSFSFTVDKLATTHQVAFTDAAALTDVVAGSTVTLTKQDGTAHSLSTGGGTLTEVVAAINGATATTGVRATAVKTADNSYRLMVESTATGAASSFTLTDGDGTALLGGSATRAGADAQISLGLGVTATSATNTFAEIVPGVSVTLGGAATVGSTATVAVAQDPSTVKTAVKDLVDQVNSLLTSLDTQTARKSSTTVAGVLSGDSTARDLRNALLGAVFGSDPTQTMATAGIETDRYGKLVFKSEVFDKAYAADPAAVAAHFTTGATTAENGWAARVAAVAKTASTSTTGTIANAITSHTQTVDRLTKSIEEWDDRLEVRRTSLQRTYTALETALSNLQSQGTWLAGQISSLPTYS